MMAQVPGGAAPEEDGRARMTLTSWATSHPAWCQGVWAIIWGLNPRHARTYQLRNRHRRNVMVMVVITDDLGAWLSALGGALSGEMGPRMTT